MDTLSYKTKSVRKEDANKDWVIVDAENLVLGRLSSKVASVLRGKHKASFTPHIDCGDHVVVINAEKVRFTGRKLEQKEYISHTGYPGGQRFKSPKDFLQKAPEKIIEMAVKGMLPKNRLGRKMYTHLHVYAGTEHPHTAQQPKAMKF